MDNFSTELNDLLIKNYEAILKIEEIMLKSMDHIDLSISELHMVEAIGKEKGDGRTISDLSKDLGITLPSVTVAIQKLVRKGYAQKVRSQVDGRVVYVVLTRQGRKVDAMHRYFHRQMVRSVGGSIPPEEKQVLIDGMMHLYDFLSHSLQTMQEKRRKRSE